MFFSKQKQKLFPDLSEQNLQYLFQILSEIQEQQYKIVPHCNYKMIEALFDIIGHVSILHDQINHLSSHEADNNDHVLKLNRITVEKSISQFFNLNQKDEYEIQKECSLTINSIISESTENSLIEELPLKEQHIMIPKIERHKSKEKCNYLRVNRSLQSMNQKFIHSSANKENTKTAIKPITKSIIHPIVNQNVHIKDDNKAIINNKINNSNPNPNLNDKKAKIASSKSIKVHQPTSTKTIISKSILPNNYCTEQKSKWINPSITLEPKTPKKRKVNGIKRNLSQEPSLDGDYINCSTREINKPTRYTKYLMNKYKGVIANYGEEMRNSLNSSLKKPRSSSKAEFTKIDPIEFSYDQPLFQNINIPLTSPFHTIQINKSGQK